MNWFKFLTDPTPNGYQDRQPVVRFLIKRCAILPANFWTLLRLPGAPLVIWLFVYSGWLALLVFLLLVLTDFIDGKVARFRGQANGAGAWLDPLVDKIFILPLLYWFGCLQSDWLIEWLFWFLLVTETAARLLVPLIWKWQGRKISVGAMKAKWWGKAKFSGQIFLMLALLAAVVYPSEIWYFTLNGFLAIVVILALLSVASYIWSVPEPINWLRRARQ